MQYVKNVCDMFIASIKILHHRIDALPQHMQLNDRENPFKNDPTAETSKL